MGYSQLQKPLSRALYLLELHNLALEEGQIHVESEFLMEVSHNLALEEGQIHAESEFLMEVSHNLLPHAHTVLTPLTQELDSSQHSSLTVRCRNLHLHRFFSILSVFFFQHPLRPFFLFLLFSCTPSQILLVFLAAVHVCYVSFTIVV
jgi:hypothetical protein